MPIHALIRALIKKHPEMDAFLRKKSSDSVKINQTIFIHDLVVRTMKIMLAFGESRDHDNAYFQGIGEFERLIDQIQFLFRLANKTHFENHREKNHITRLSTHEFFFYTEDPLTLDGFNILAGEIEEMAKKLQSDVY